MTQITVTLTPRSAQALQLAAELCEDTRTDTVNRAVQLYAFVQHLLAGGGEVLIRKPGGELEQIMLL